MKPTDALEIQHDYKWKCGDTQFRYILDKMILSASGIGTHIKNQKDYLLRDSHNGSQTLTPAEQKVVVNQYLDSAMRVGVSKDTPCYFVKDEMSDLIMFASQKLDNTDLVDEALVPTDKGFVYFEKPLELNDVRGRRLLINIVVWEKGFAEKSGKPLICMTFFNDSARTPDDVAIQILNDEKERKYKAGWRRATDIVGRFGWVHSANIEHGEMIGEYLNPIDDKETETLRDFTTDKDGNFIELDDEAWETYKKEKLFPYTNARRLIYTYFMIMNQTLTAKTPERGDRAQRRRLERENLPSEVLVIQFRKTRYTSAEGGEERNVNWSHRWIVGGHWRWQPYKDPASGGEIKKRIWISPYVKGPDDKPLKTKERVYVLAK